MAAASEPCGVLLVGSVPMDSAEEVFTRVCSALPERLTAVPDGETAERGNWIVWQLGCFPRGTLLPIWGGDDSKSELNLEVVKPTRYDDVAIASYAIFKQLRTAGKIPPGVRFQVSLPAPYNVLQAFIKPEYVSAVEPLYEQRLNDALSRIFATIPHNDLVIQWDLAFDPGALEFERGRPGLEWFKFPYNKPVIDAINERLTRLFANIPRDVHHGFHICYGDLQHKHYVEPEDTSILVELANNIVQLLGAQHPIDWVHMPVPRDREDAAYFEPLRQLQLGTSRLYLGLVHPNDEKGTRARIRAAQAVYKECFGVASECGLGRTPRDELDSIFAISVAVTQPSERIVNGH